MGTSYIDVPILESVTNIAKQNKGPQEVYLYYENVYLYYENVYLNETIKNKYLDKQNYGIIF